MNNICAGDLECVMTAFRYEGVIVEYSPEFFQKTGGKWRRIRRVEYRPPERMLDHVARPPVVMVHTGSNHADLAVPDNPNAKLFPYQGPEPLWRHYEIALQEPFAAI